MGEKEKNFCACGERNSCDALPKILFVHNTKKILRHRFFRVELREKGNMKFSKGEGLDND